MRVSNLKLVALFFLLCSASLSSYGQKSKLVESGVVNGVPYASTDFEDINLTNGNLNINFPLAGLQGRGQAGFTYHLRYSSKLWQTITNPIENPFYEPNPTYQNFMAEANDAGWQDGAVFSINIWDRGSTIDYPTINPSDPTVQWMLSYKWKVEMSFPDGRKVEFRPIGHSDVPSSGSGTRGYFTVHPNGTDGLRTTYYSSDGSGMRLTFANNEASTLGYVWEVSMPDGSRIVQLSTGQRIIDRNGNYVETATVTLPDSTQLPGWRDQVGRYVAVKKNYAANEDRYYQLGFNGELLTWKVKWKTIYVRKNYVTTCNTCPPQERGPVTEQQWAEPLTVVDRIELPEQLGVSPYIFEYYAKDQDDQNLSSGWGEVKSITLPTGAKVSYGYGLSQLAQGDEMPGIPAGETNYRVDQILEWAGRIRYKRLQYTEVHDGVSTPREDAWSYVTGATNTSSTVTGPDGGVTTLSFYDIVNDQQKGGQVYKEIKSDGTKIERVWANNYPSGMTYGSGNHMNAFVKTEFVTIPDANGNPSLTKITDFNYDKNGNMLWKSEYDWVPANSSSILRDGSGKVTGFSGLTPVRSALNTYYNPANAYDQTYTANDYYLSSAPRLRNLVKTTEVWSGGAVTGTPVTRAEMYYDGATDFTVPPPEVGNATLTKTWDSFKDGASRAYSAPLTGTNSVSVTSSYDSYGNPTLMTDAKDNQTQITYGPVNGHSGLYPTQTKTAYNTLVQRTWTAVYDFHTGVVTSMVDVDNSNATTTSTYDALGRPLTVTNPLGATAVTQYNDALRRIIVKSDLETVGDGKKVAIQHFDQLGRVRLARTLEDVSTQDAEDPCLTTSTPCPGIKVQTRYKTVSGYTYQLTSNPYRASTSGADTDPTMGWTLSTAWSSGIRSEVQTFAGAGLPTAFGGSNTTSTGIARTDIDAERTLVTDQAGKQRIRKTNALGQLKDVWEVTASDANTEAITFGNPAVNLNGYKTSYSYDTLSNLTTVNQGAQTRTFTYSTLSRLTSATNPELGTTPTNGTINYQYDSNGNLTRKTDARGVQTDYIYDALNRVTNRNYSTPGGTPPNYQASPDVTYTYDNVTNAKGKLTKVASSVSTTEYVTFDILGRVAGHKQTTDGGDSGGYTTAYVYNLAGALIEETYPSGRKVQNVLDASGDLAVVKSKKNATSGPYHNYAFNFIYNAAGAVTSMELGNLRYESTVFNSRLQPTQIALGTTAGATNVLKLDYTYGTSGTNNGNIASQSITVPTVGTSTGFVAVQTYNYDSLNRVQDATENVTPNGGSASQSWKQTFTYDRYGNRRFNFNSGATTTPESSCSEAVCNPTISTGNNRLSSTGWSYDSGGNTTGDPDGRTFVYDGENKQVEVTTASTVHGQYWHDGDGKRVKKIAGAEVTIFVYDAAGKLVAEYSSTVASQQDAKVAYLTNDHLGSPRANTDRDGSVTARHDYHPFGEDISTSQRTDALGYVDDTIRKQFTGYERDRETDLDFAQARMYSNILGRFTSFDGFNILLAAQMEKDRENAKKMLDDFLNDGQRWNRYSYVLNSPTTKTDPTGLDIMIIENHATGSNGGGTSNPFGHTAIAVTGYGVYSMGNGANEPQTDGKNNIIGGSVRDYIDREIPRRDSTIIIIKTTKEQDAAIVKELESIAASKPKLTQSGILSDNCVVRVHAALDAGQVGSSAGTATSVPGTVGNRVAGTAFVNTGKKATIFEIPKNANLNQQQLQVMRQFEPRTPLPKPGSPGGTPVVTRPARTVRVRGGE